MWKANSLVLGWLVRMCLYGSVTAAVVLFYDLQCTVRCGRHNFLSSVSCNKVNKQLQREPRNNIGAMNRAQQAYFIKNNTFSDSMTALEIGIKDSSNYRYRIVQPMGLVEKLNQLVPSDTEFEFKIMIAHGTTPQLKNYIGVVYTPKPESASQSASETERLTQAILCQMNNPGELPTTLPFMSNEVMQCPSGSLGPYP